MPIQPASPNLIGYYRERCDPPLSQAQLAALLGVSLRSIKSWEQSGCAKPAMLLQILAELIQRRAIQSRTAANRFWEVSGNRQQPFAKPPEYDALIKQLPAVESVLLTPSHHLFLPDRSYMPYTRYPTFVGRAAELEWLASILQPTLATAVISGMAGMGKTQLAVEFAYRYGQSFTGGVFWINMSDAQSAQLDVAACGHTMQMPDEYRSLSIAAQAEAVRQAWKQVAPQLLIFDNCEDAQLLADWKPQEGGCRVLVTARQKRWEHVPEQHILELPELARGESITLLRSMSSWATGYDTELGTLAAELGDLPLGIFLVASYLKRYRAVITPATYLLDLRTYLLQHPSLAQPSLEYSPTKYQMPLDVAFMLSYQRLHPGDFTDLDALTILDRMVFFAVGETVSRDLLAETFEISHKDRFRRIELEDAIQLLLNLGLLTTTISDAVRIHRLVRYAIQQQARFLRAQREAQESVEQAVMRLAQRADEQRDLALMATLVPHLQSLAALAAPRSDDEAIKLSYWCGWLLGLLRNKELSLTYCTQMRDLTLQRYGTDHPELANSYNLIGMVCMMQSLFVKAQDAFQQALTIWETSYGPMHEKTARGYQNYAYLLVLRGDYLQALMLARRALHAAHRRGAILDLTVARRLHIVGWALQRLGHFFSAVRCLRLALSIRKTLLAENHIAVFLTLAVLGDTLLQMKKIDEADAIYQQAYTAHVGAYGEHASFSGELLHRVGHVMLVRGNLKGAIATLRQALRVLDHSLGQQAWDNAFCRHTLANALVLQGKDEEAWAHYQLVYAVYQDQLIADHTDTLHVQQRMAEIAAKYPQLVAHQRF